MNGSGNGWRRMICKAAGQTLLEFDDLPGGYKVLRPDADEIDSFRKGRKVAIVATARKIAVIMYKMLETGQEYNYGYSKEESMRFKKIQIKNTIKKIKRLGIKKEELDLAF